MGKENNDNDINIARLMSDLHNINTNIEEIKANQEKQADKTNDTNLAVATLATNLSNHISLEETVAIVKKEANTKVATILVVLGLALTFIIYQLGYKTGNENNNNNNKYYDKQTIRKNEPKADVGID